MPPPVNTQLTALTRDPSREALRVYADQRLERGDLHGELILLQLTRAERDSQPSEREQRLLREVFEPAVRGAVGGRIVQATTWRDGFLHELRLHSEGAPFEGLRELARRPEAALLERIAFDGLQWEGQGSLAALWSALAGGPRFPRLRALEVEEGVDAGNPYIEGPAVIGDVQPLCAAYPGLEVLTLNGVGHHFGQLDLPSLKRFSAATLDVRDVNALATARWPQLEELELQFGDAHGEAEPLFGPLLAARMSPHLRRVRVKSPWPEFFGAALPRAPLGRGRVVEV